MSSANPSPSSPQRPLVLAGSLAVVALLVGLGVGRWTAPAAGPSSPAPEGAAEVEWWTCSMHPQIKLPEPGDCPICGMDLIPLREDTGGDRAPRELRLSERAAALAEIQTAPVERRPVTRAVRLVGKVDYDETRLEFITAWFPGRLDRLYVDYTGTLVRQGDHLADVFSPELLSAQEELLQARRAFDKIARGGSPLLAETARATLAASREKLRLWGLTAEQVAAIERAGEPQDHVTIYAPSGGVVVHKNKNAGDYVRTGERIYTIADLSQVWVKLDAYESDLPWVRYGQTVTFEAEALPGRTFGGRVVFIDPVVTPETRTVKVRLNVANPEGLLKPGLFVRARLEAPLGAAGATMDPALEGTWICPMHWEVIRPEPGACVVCGMPLVPAESLHQTAEVGPPPLVVPASAVLWTGVRSLVYVRLPGDAPRFVGQEVVLGPRAGEWYVIREGLEEGDLVVTHGAFKIDSALQIEARPSMMLPPDPAPPPVERLEVSPAALEALAPVVAGYLEAQAALAADDLVAARAGLGGVAAAVDAVDMGLFTGPAHLAWMQQARALAEAAAAAGAAPDLDAARAAFAELSAAVLELERRFGHPLAQEVQEVFCPMAFDDAGAAWLQPVGEVSNPYFGASMLRCGEVRERFAPAPAEPAPPPVPLPPDEGEGGAARPEPEEPAPAGAAAPAEVPAAPEEAAPPGPPADVEPPPPEARVRRQLAAVFDRYLQVQERLAADEAAGGEAVDALRAALTSVAVDGLAAPARAAWDDLEGQLLRAIDGLGAAEGLAAQRRAFEPLSETLLAAFRRFGAPPERTVRVFRCPMAFEGKGADWLQEAERTLNPYFGSRMLRCGSQEAVVAPLGGDE